MQKISNKRKNEDGGDGGRVEGSKRGKQDFSKGSKGNQKGNFGQNGWKPKAAEQTKNKQGDKLRNSKKKQLSSIVTEAKANYQLYSDKKVDKSEKQLLMNATYDLVKDHIPELARMKGMGKIIGSLIDRKNKKQLALVQNCYRTIEDKLLLIKGNGYRLAIKIIQNSDPKTVQEYVDACLSNAKGLRVLMHSFKSARVLCAAYTCANAAAKRKILTKLAVGNMPIQNPETPLNEVFQNCKEDVVEGCKTFLQSILNEKTIQQDLIQDIMLLCIETHKSTGMDIEEFVKLASENILPICRRTTNCTLALWVAWLSTAQMRKHIMKSLKGKVISLLQTYNGRMFTIALFESTDDTKALHKMVLKEFLDSLSEVVQQTEVRKLLEFLLLPRSTKVMHPKEIEILKKGDDVRTSKKSNEARFDEIRDYLREPIIAVLKENCKDWFKDNKMCLFIIFIVDRFGATFEADIIGVLSKILSSSEFHERLHDKAVRMVLESLVNADVARYGSNEGDSLFLNEFIPSIDKEQISNLINKSPRIVTLLYEGMIKVQKALTFKFKKSWIHDKKAQNAIQQWKSQKKP